MLTATSKISLGACPEVELKEQKEMKKRHLGKQDNTDLKKG